MPQLKPDSEEALELATLKLFETLGYSTANCYHEWASGQSTLGRETKTEVVLISKLRPALAKLNPHLSETALNLAIEQLTRNRTALSLANANREVYHLLKDGIKVSYRDDDHLEITETVKIIDWREPTNNDFFLASQFWINGETYTKRTDLLGFVNGIPLVFIELKAHKEPVEKAYNDNFCDYRKTIPQLFWYNGIVILSNGSQAKIGSLTATWEYFSDWKRINNEGEEGLISLDTLIRGTCEKTRLLDLLENFTLFAEEKGKVIKLVAKNHQYLGVNNALEAVRHIRENQGKLGVFWHTQGSGKSYSMQFFAQKVHRVLSGNWTFVIITDRDDLDDQIYQNFAKTGAVTEPENHVRATSGEHLKQLLAEDHRYVFTLIQKFRTTKGETKYPQLSERGDIIVIADEAHRSQYDIYAKNMREALPNAGLIGFTGTPLMAAEEATRREFGDYISIYNFRQSIEDGATVPLYYENRIPQLELVNECLNEEITDAIEAADLDEQQEAKLALEFAREYHLLTREERLEEVAADLVSHFLGRGQRGKAMVISVDRFTTVRMYDKVQHHWQRHLEALKLKLPHAEAAEREALSAKIQYMAQTDMAVIISSSHNEEEAFALKGLDIKPHRQRLAKETPKLDEKFKDSDHPLRIVFVCAMWMTGFDVPSCSTIYLDKPMRNHTLMQTIARANRVFPDKINGLIVDYIGVFRNLQKALAIYGAASGGGVAAGDTPVHSKAELVTQLREQIEQITQFFGSRQINFTQLQSLTDPFQHIKAYDEAVEAILSSDLFKEEFLTLSRTITKVYRAILPDPSASEFTARVAILTILTQKICNLNPTPNISEIKAQVEEILDESISALSYVIPQSSPIIDLSQIDFEALKRQFETGYRHTETEKLKNTITCQLDQMVRFNKTRINYYDRFQQMISEYNSGCRNVEDFFAQLLELAQQLTQEEQRAISENLDEEKLALFDLLTKPELNLTEKEKKAVKIAAEELLTLLKREKLVLDWRKRQQTRASVRVAIEEVLDRKLPEVYSPELYERKCEEVYQHIYESYFGAGRSIYISAA